MVTAMTPHREQDEQDEERSQDRGRSGRQRKPSEVVSVVSAVIASLASVGGAASYKSVSDQLGIVAVTIARLDEKVSSVSKLEDRVRCLERDMAEIRATMKERGK